MNRKKQASQKQDQQNSSQPLRVEVDYSNSLSSGYANYAAISHSANEFFIDFCVIAPPYNVKAEEALLYAQPFTRIIIPAVMASALVEALRTQIAEQEKTLEKSKIKDEAEQTGS